MNTNSNFKGGTNNGGRSVHFLDLGKRKAKISPQKKVMLKSMFDIVYEGCTNKEQAEKIVNKIARRI